MQYKACVVVLMRYREVTMLLLLKVLGYQDIKMFNVEEGIELGPRGLLIYKIPAGNTRTTLA
jgi:hypothetical protein